jgi:Leucine-rich repeat (LRR) protein/transcription initiation factor TFIIIB Brf1 subunit/transcription initiation factor TFIIB
MPYTESGFTSISKKSAANPETAGFFFNNSKGSRIYMIGIWHPFRRFGRYLIPNTICPECYGTVDNYAEDIICDECGLVVETGDIFEYNGDHLNAYEVELEVNAFQQPGDEASLLGSFINPLNNQLLVDGRNAPLTPACQKKFKRLKRLYELQLKIQKRENDYRVLKILKKIVIMFSLSGSVKVRAAYFYQKIKNSASYIRNHVSLIGFCIFYASRDFKQNAPLSIREISRALQYLGHRVEPRHIIQDSIEYQRYLVVRTIPHKSEDFIPRFINGVICDNLAINRLKNITPEWTIEAYRLALDHKCHTLLKFINSRIRGCRNPFILAATTVYCADKIIAIERGTPSVLTLKIAADAMQVPARSISEHYRKVYKAQFPDIGLTKKFRSAHQVFHNHWLELSDYNAMLALEAYYGAQISYLDDQEDVLYAPFSYTIADHRIVALSLAESPRKCIPKCVALLKHMKALNISNKLLARLPNWINELKLLERLNLCANRFSKLPAWLAGLPSLKEIALNQNSLKEFPLVIRSIQSLIKLDCSENILTEIPPWIGELSEIIELNVSHNHLLLLPQEIGQMTSLQRLNLSNNCLKYLPDCFENLIFLSHFEVAQNWLDSLPVSLKNAENLNYLDCSGNQISEFTANIADSLGCFLASGNPIRLFPEMLRHPPKLRCVDLSNTQISEIPDWIGECRNLLSINISGTQIAHLPQSFWALYNLHTLKASGCPFTRIPEILIALPALKTVTFASDLLPSWWDDILYGRWSTSDNNFDREKFTAAIDRMATWTPDDLLGRLERNQGFSAVDVLNPLIPSIAGWLEDQVLTIDTPSARNFLAELRRRLLWSVGSPESEEKRLYL